MSCRTISIFAERDWKPRGWPSGGPKGPASLTEKWPEATAAVKAESENLAFSEFLLKNATRNYSPI